MRSSAFAAALLTIVTLVFQASAEDQCPHLKSRSGLLGYDQGGPYKLDHFKLTKGRTELRDFLWKHWRNHIKGVAEAKMGTIDAGMKQKAAPPLPLGIYGVQQFSWQAMLLPAHEVCTRTAPNSLRSARKLASLR